MSTVYIIDVFPRDGWKSVRTFEVQTHSEMEDVVEYIEENFDMGMCEYEVIVIRETTT